MSPSTPDPGDILDNISMLYELSLGIGTSLKLHENCEFFVQKLMSRQNLSFVAIYTSNSLGGALRWDTASDDSSHCYGPYHCLCSCPQLSTQELETIVSIELLEQVQSEGMLCLSTQQDVAKRVLPQGMLHSFPGVVSAFSVCEGQVIIVLINQVRSSPYLDWELKQLHLLLDKFGRSVQACLNYESLQRATQAKIALEKKLAQTQRLESLGLMAGGLAHDLGNVLNPLTAYPGLLSRAFAEGTQEQLMLSQIQDAVNKASAMMKDLSILTRKPQVCQTPMPLVLPIRQYFTSATFFALQSAEPNICCQWQLDSESRVLADNTMITRVILNLVTNAFDALNGYGNVDIRVYDCDLVAPYHGYTTIPSGQYVVLAVEDNGQGIPEEALGYIFEPFFSKKKLGRSGSGLGLAVVYSIVEGLKGFIDVETSAEGTSLKMYFPRVVTQETKSVAPLLTTMEGKTSRIGVTTSAEQKTAEDELAEHKRSNASDHELVSNASSNTSAKSAQETIRDDIGAMPESWLREFEMALASLDTRLIEGKMEEIPKEYEQLRRAIASLLKHYRYDILLELIQTQC